MYLFFALCVLNIISWSDQRSIPEDDHYVAAVVEYQVHPDLHRNLDQYMSLIEEAAMRGADIVVFPEMTLTSGHSVPVPVHGLLRRYPVPALHPQHYDEVLVKLSSVSRQNQIYVVVNVQELMDCTVPAEGENCPRSEVYRFNTNVVFDRKGAVVDRYRKINLFGEYTRSPALTPDLGYFETDFGVRFGHFICFDLMFQVPAVQVVQKLNLTDVVFSTMWFSEMPYLTEMTLNNSTGAGRRLLAIYTGGTFGMLKNDKGVLVPQKNIEAVIRRLPQLHDVAYWKKHMESDEDMRSYLVLPDGKDTTMKVFYKILEYEELKDSSDFNVDDWIKMARDVKKYYDEYDGFVVLHGTDTTAYGASALSFMLESIGKTVVLTGAQVPIFQPRSDGLNNFLSALLIAATHHIPEVTVFFGAKLFRGNRVKKVSNTRIHGFDSPNYPALLEAKSTIEWDPHGPPGELPEPSGCTLHDQLSRNVYVLKVAPTITGDIIRMICRPPIEGVILETLGNGNMPIKRKEIYEELRAAVRAGVLIVNVTQCINGTVLSRPLYETGRLVAECGVVPAYDMTQEAALAKLAYVLTKKDLTYEQKVQMMTTNIRGELTKRNI